MPTLLTIARLYEIFPLGHFNILLPISAILIALTADWSRFHLDKAAIIPDPAPNTHDTQNTQDAKDAAEPKGDSLQCLSFSCPRLRSSSDIINSNARARP